MMLLAFGGPHADSWQQAGQLALALLLTGLIGFERELRHKSAGLRTHATVGLSAALMTQVSKCVLSVDVDIPDMQPD